MNKYYLDANFLLYLLDETSSFYIDAQGTFSRIVEANGVCCVSHQTLEEMIHVLRTLYKENISMYSIIRQVLLQISAIPTLTIVTIELEISKTIAVIKLMEDHHLKSNDAYILATMIDNGIYYLVTYDQQLRKAAEKANLNVFTGNVNQI